MNPPISDLIVRCAHVLAAAVVVGGLFFFRIVLMPAATKLPEEAHEGLRGRLSARWRVVVHSSTGLLLVSGLIRVLQVAPRHQGQGIYHALLGVKVLLAVVIFVVGVLLVSRHPAYETMRRAQGKWLGLNLTLAIIVILLAVYLHLMPPAQPG